MKVVVDVGQLGALVKSWRAMSAGLRERGSVGLSRSRELESCAEALETLCVAAGAVVVDAAGRRRAG